MPVQIDTPARRRKLGADKAPVWSAIGQARGGLKLGYRKGARGGVWVAKLVSKDVRQEAKLGPADDDGASEGALSFVMATQAAIAWAGGAKAQAEAAAEAANRQRLTVAEAVKSYIAMRVARNARTGANARSRLDKHVTPAKLSSRMLATITAAGLKEWRDGLDPKLAPATLNRTIGDLRAALRAALAEHWRVLPATLPREIEQGLKAIPGAAQARVAVLPDADVKAVVAAACDTDADLGALVLVLAATGMRFSQIAALTVADVQQPAQRIMVPPSRKGRSPKAKARIAVPVGADVIERLLPLLTNRRGHEPLLLRWAHKQNGVGRTGAGRWTRTARTPWGMASEMLKGWRAALKAADVAYVEPYCLRHSSIVRGLTAGLPVRLVAAQHDTSIEMIERHYAAYIVDATEELARRAVVPLAPAAIAHLRAVT